MNVLFVYTLIHRIINYQIQYVVSDSIDGNLAETECLTQKMQGNVICSHFWRGLLSGYVVQYIYSQSQD